jgi:hypothetical protein
MHFINLVGILFRMQQVKLTKYPESCLIMNSTAAYYIILHMRFSTIFYNYTLFNLFGLDILNNNYILVYEFKRLNKNRILMLVLTTQYMYSISMLFKNAC